MTVSRSLAACLVCATVSAARPGFAQIRHITLEGADGITLQATLYASGAPAPGVLLHHMCGDWRADYHALARTLMETGFSVLTYDLRGEGETGGDRPFVTRLFGVTARDDRASQLAHYERLRALDRVGDGVRIYDDGGHGTRNLSRHPELIDEIVAWIGHITGFTPNQGHRI